VLPVLQVPLDTMVLLALTAALALKVFQVLLALKVFQVLLALKVSQVLLALKGQTDTTVLQAQPAQPGLQVPREQLVPMEAMDTLVLKVQLVRLAPASALAKRFQLWRTPGTTGVLPLLLSVPLVMKRLVVVLTALIQAVEEMQATKSPVSLPQVRLLGLVVAVTVHSPFMLFAAHPRRSKSLPSEADKANDRLLFISSC
jgi:hypothetical protein